MNTRIGSLQIGLKGEAGQKVTEHDTAFRYGSSLVKSYSTPAMIALIENACVKTIERSLREGETSVGVEVNVRHLAPTPVGMEVTASTELVEVDGRRLRFKVKVEDEKEAIGEGEHARVVVNSTRFDERVKNKRL